MADFFDFLRDHAAGIFISAAIIAFSAGLLVWFIQKLSWIFRWGRFVERASPLSLDGDSGSLVRLISRFLVEIIAEFRNLLALLIFMLFAGILIYAAVEASRFGTNLTAPKDIAQATQLETARLDGIGKLIQVIVASLGGLVGSIIGYYFGEAGRKASPAPPPVPATATPSQALGGEVKVATPPPGV